MKRKHIQNKVAESRIALSVTAVYGLLVWLASGLIQQQLWLSFILFLVSTYLIVELNNQNALIRIYSRMVSCSFIMLTAMTAIHIKDVGPFAVQLSFIAFYSILFHTYQSRRSTGWVFFAFCCISIGSLFWVHELYFVPVLWIILGTNLMAFSCRSFLASILGLLMPYWFAAGYEFYLGDITPLADHFRQLGEFLPVLPFYEHETPLRFITITFVTVLGITGTIHFLRNSFKDKIRTRMLYEIFITLFLCTLAFLILQPQHEAYLLLLLIINVSLLISHFIALTHTKITNIAFFVIVAATLGLTFLNLWMPSFTF